MIVLDTTIVNVALPSIRDDLGFTQTSLAWVVNAYLLTFGGFLLLGGRLGDLFGHRRLFLIGIALFTARVAGLRPVRRRRRCSSPRARVQGIGGAIVSAVALSLIMKPVHRAGRAREGDGHLRLRRCRAAARSASCSAACSPTSLSWHWIFLVNVPDRRRRARAVAAAAARRSRRGARAGSTSPARSPSPRR